MRTAIIFCIWIANYAAGYWLERAVLLKISKEAVIGRLLSSKQYQTPIIML